MVNKIKIKKDSTFRCPARRRILSPLTEPHPFSPLFRTIFPGYTWKVAVKAGDTVRIGDQLLYAKEDEDIGLVSPVAGTVTEIRRGRTPEDRVCFRGKERGTDPDGFFRHKG